MKEYYIKCWRLILCKAFGLSWNETQKIFRFQIACLDNPNDLIFHDEPWGWVVKLMSSRISKKNRCVENDISRILYLKTNGAGDMLNEKYTKLTSKDWKAIQVKLNKLRWR